MSLVGDGPSSGDQPRVTLMARALAFPAQADTPAAAAARHPPRMHGKVEARRFMLLEDGSAFGGWSDGVSLLLHPHGRTLTQLLPDGAISRHVAAYAGSAMKGKLDELTSFMRRHTAPSLQSSGDGLAATNDLSWRDNPAHSVQLLHAMPDSLPKNSLVNAMWTPEATFICHSNEKRVVASVHADQSTLALEPSGFFHHLLPAIDTQASVERTGSYSTDANGRHQETNPREKVYAPNAVPAVHNASGLNPDECTYDLAPIAATARRLQRHAIGVAESRVLVTGEADRKLRLLEDMQPGFEMTDDELAELSFHPGCTKKTAAAFSATMHERSVVRQVGEFTAFKDGRVKCRFVDRCLLDLNVSRTEVNMLLPNGFPIRVTIPSDEVRQYERYIRPTLEFAAWAYHTPTERAEQQRSELTHSARTSRMRRDQLRREMVQFEIARTKRFLAMQRMARGDFQALGDIDTNASSRVNTSAACVQSECDVSSLTLRARVTADPAHRATPVACTPSMLPPFVVHTASNTSSASGSVHPSPARNLSVSPAYLSSEHHLSSFLSPIALQEATPMHAHAHGSTPSFFASPDPVAPPAPFLSRSPTAPSPLPSFSSSPSPNDVSFWLRDLKQRNQEMKQRLDQHIRQISGHA